MPIPELDIDEVSQDVIGVYSAILSSRSQLGDAALVFFLDQVPERGSQLWERFVAFRDEQEGRTFIDFVKSVVTKDPLKIFYPKECTLDQMSKQFLASEIQSAIRNAKIGNDAEMLGIYFGEGVAYDAMRKIACMGCPMDQCRHLLRRWGA